MSQSGDLIQIHIVAVALAAVITDDDRIEARVQVHVKRHSAPCSPAACARQAEVRGRDRAVDRYIAGGIAGSCSVADRDGPRGGAVLIDIERDARSVRVPPGQIPAARVAGLDRLRADSVQPGVFGLVDAVAGDVAGIVVGRNELQDRSARSCRQALHVAASGRRRPVAADDVVRDAAVVVGLRRVLLQEVQIRGVVCSDAKLVQVAREHHFEAGPVVLPLIRQRIGERHVVDDVVRGIVGVGQVAARSRRLIEGQRRPQERSVVVREIPVHGRAAAGAFDMVVDFAAGYEPGFQPGIQPLGFRQISVVACRIFQLDGCHDHRRVGRNVFLGRGSIPLPPDAASVRAVVEGINLIEQEGGPVPVFRRSGQLISPHAGQRPPAQVVIEVIGHHVGVLGVEAGIYVVDHRPVDGAVRPLIGIHHRLPKLRFPPEVGIQASVRPAGMRVDGVIAVRVEVFGGGIVKGVDQSVHGRVGIGGCERGCRLRSAEGRQRQRSRNDQNRDAFSQDHVQALSFGKGSIAGLAFAKSALLPLGAAERDALHKILLKHEEQHENRQRRDQRACHHRAEVGLVVVRERLQPHLNRRLPGIVQNDHRPQEAVPARLECEDAERRQGRLGQRQVDVPEDPELSAALDPGLQVTR
ncbi:hypothetical protein BN871_CE_00110 [Paenibacillus sp. P22]|nr:hypothetical protein BN871_CE_00110 [Paenibacillus sp. P22]